MKKRFRIVSLVLSLILCLSSLLCLSGCKNEESEEKKGYEKNPDLDTSEEIQLIIADSREAWPEMDAVITKFEAIYPNCSVVCESIEDYFNNLVVRLAQDEQKVDIFSTTNITETTRHKDYALNLISEDAKKILDLSDTNSGLVDNFKYRSEENTQYAIPYGGEMRGMFVNVTLLNKFGLEVPTNRAELLNCCEVLYNEGYIPFQSSSGTFGQQILYPYICNIIVNGGNYEELFDDIDNAEPGVSENFRDAYEFLYNIVGKGYYDYKRAENEYGYTFDKSDGKARDFLNVLKVADDTFEKKDDVGNIAFMIDTQALESELDKVKSDYHSEIEYKFITSPVGEDGGYAYLSPADGLAINNKSDNTDWALEFLNFFFTHDVNTEFALDSSKIPNTKDALVRYDVPDDHACDVGQVTFNNFNFYAVVTPLLTSGYDDMIGISKMNSPKYMIDNGDGTYSLKYTLDDYMARLEAEIQKTKQAK